MCFCNWYSYRSGLTRLGEGFEGSLHFLGEGILTISLLRLAVNAIFGI